MIQEFREILEKNLFIRKVRYGHPVVSEYVGTGQVAELVAQLGDGEREAAERHRAADRQAIQRAQAADTELVRLSDTIRGT